MKIIIYAKNLRNSCVSAFTGIWKQRQVKIQNTLKMPLKSLKPIRKPHNILGALMLRIEEFLAFMIYFLGDLITLSFPLSRYHFPMH